MRDELEARVEALERRVAELEGRPAEGDVAAEVAAAVFGVPPEEAATLSMDTHPGWDSLKQVEFLVALEERAGVRLASADLAGLTSVAAARDLLRSRP
jgi:acyl carrier protein